LSLIAFSASKLSRQLRISPTSRPLTAPTRIETAG
jgi:hypothetical protein